MEAAFVVHRCWNPLAHGSQQRCVVPSPRLNRVSTSFNGEQLTRRSSNGHALPQIKRVPVGAARAHSHPHPPPPAASPGPGVQDGFFLDDMSRFLYKKIGAALSPYFPREYDPLDWLPESIHSKVHNSEAAAVAVLREALHFGLFYLVYMRVDGFCKWLNWLYVTNSKLVQETAEDHYPASSFKAMTGPLRLLIMVFAVTRFISVMTPVLKITLGAGTIARIRSTSVVVAVTWFFFKWKHIYVEHLCAKYKLDAPRIVAFDKIVSLILYFIAASCIGEVNGFALRSLLAVGGFGGVALGLAAKEIVSNFFGGALLFITRPFVIGERIKAGNFAGYVQDIGFLQTKILSIERVPMVVPNQSFINQVITNYSRANNKLLEAAFPVRIQDIFHVDRITSRVLHYLRAHPDVDPNKSTPVCYLKSLNQAGVEIAVTCVVKPTGGSEFYRVQQLILMHVAEIIVSEGAALGSSAQFAPDVPPWAVAAIEEANMMVEQSPVLE